MFDCWTTVGLLAATLLLLYLFVVRNNDHWEKRGIAFIKPVPLLGNMANAITRKRTFVDEFTNFYTQLKPNRFGGLFTFMSPAILVTSPELIRDITVKNFEFFHDRQMIGTKDSDPLFSRSLPVLQGDEWREMRNKLTPAFTASKLRSMVPTISKCANPFAKFLVNRKEADTEPIEFQSTFTRFTNDVIATSAFGVETNAVQNPDEEFYKFVQKKTGAGAQSILIIAGFRLFPKLMTAMGYSLTSTEVNNFFLKIIKGTMEYRDKNNITRPDMLQLLIDAKKGKLKREAGEDVGTIGEDDAASEFHKKHIVSKKADFNITDDDIAAQAFGFFSAGYETVSTLLAFMAHELAENPEIQERLQEEIDQTMKEGPLSYESVVGMKYLDMVVSEALRKYPPAVVLQRNCQKNYKVPGTDKVIEAGISVSIPIYPLHRDPEYFPNPEKFDPERFSAENKGNIKPYTYLPFGSGPHNCIGMRFALLEAKLCFIHILATCNLKVCAKTEIPLQLSKKTFTLTTDNGSSDMLDFWTTSGLLLATALLLYIYVSRNNDYWARKGIICYKPMPFIGSFSATLFKKLSFADALNENYMLLKPHGLGGVFEFTKPALLVTNPQLIRDIAVKNFDHFHDRRNMVSEDADPLIAHSLPVLKGEKWREMRNKLSPAFTGSKLRGMFPHISKCASQFAKFLVNREEAGTEPIEFKSIFTRLTNDVIASTAFGVEINAVENPEEKFYKFAETMVDFGTIRTLLIMVFPKLMAALGISFTPKEVTNYFLQIIKGTMEFREKKNISRPDMLQLLMAAQKGKLKKEVDEDVVTIGEDSADSEFHKKFMSSKKEDSIQITDEEITAQAFIFFFAGYESVATILAFLAHELAENPDVQDRLREEIDQTLQDGLLSHESVNGMKYLDMVVSETFRKYPPTPMTDRTCVRNYMLPGTDKVIEAGTIIYLPIYPLHRDPEYFTDPLKFDPERFSDENKGNIKPYTYLPFGVGPHNCLGMRLALLEVKLSVIYMLSTCTLSVCSKTEIPLQLSKSIKMTTDNGFWLLAIPRQNPTLDV